ncbi:PREDICTED: multidrug resistance-associated protein 4-like [Trachymyrmex septentrionalis]|uniref:multidrug resistance-associated protein 4-like n=1 Tax=Trachymyrmex septentrionalis TaxID=34720 RepID=UPI00084F7F4C|nr:PREDICTED: multidrug resistance-associated protein 4-like [Trachymyrmex septentrionalis]
MYGNLLRLNTAAMNQIGQIMNLLSNDVIRFDQLTMYLNYIWIMSFMTAIIGTIMWQKVGILYLVGIGTLLIIVLPGQETLCFLNLKLRTMIALLTDRRVQLMSELIARIQANQQLSTGMLILNAVVRTPTMHTALVAQMRQLSPKKSSRSINWFCPTVN